MPAYYTVVQYVPDPVADERINIGVIVYSKERVLCHFLNNWRRVQNFGGEHIDFLRDFAVEIEQVLSPDLVLSNMPGAWHLDEEAIKKMALNWANSIQMVQPRGSMLEADRLLLYCTDRFLREPVTSKREYRPKATAARIAADSVADAIVLRFGQNEIGHFLARQAPVAGRLEQHRVDASVGNGRLVGVVQGLSFEGPDTPDRDVMITKTVYALEDIKRLNPEASSTVLVLEPLKKSKDYDRLRSILPKIKAEMVSEQDASYWAKELVSRLPPPERTLNDPH